MTNLHHKENFRLKYLEERKIDNPIITHKTKKEKIRAVVTKDRETITNEMTLGHIFKENLVKQRARS